MRYTFVIFDLDGTLADSFPWFLRHVNGVADRFAFRHIAEHDIETLRRAGSREILKRLEVPTWKLPMIARHMRRLKAAHLADIALFPGVDTMLHALADGGLRLGLVSSDHEANARAQLGPANAALFSYFECGASMFGKATKFRRLLKHAKLDVGNAISIGDEVRDIEAARAAGLATGAVIWGYAAEEALTAHEPDMMLHRLSDIPLSLLARHDRASHNAREGK